jgi:hypothetical protein
MYMHKLFTSIFSHNAEFNVKALPRYVWPFVRSTDKKEDLQIISENYRAVSGSVSPRGDPLSGPGMRRIKGYGLI